MIDILTIAAVILGGLLETMGYEGFGGVSVALGVMRLFAVFGQGEQIDT